MYGVNFSPPDTTPLNFAFHLTKLTISISHDFPLPLLAAFLQPTVSSLILEVSYRNEDSIHAEKSLQLIEAQAPYVKSLKIENGPDFSTWLGLNNSPRRFQQRANAFIESFSGIQKFDCILSDLEWRFLDNWPTTLETLAVWFGVHYDVGDLSKLLHRVGETLRKVNTLKTLSVHYGVFLPISEGELWKAVVEQALEYLKVACRSQRIGYSIHGQWSDENWFPPGVLI